MWFPQERHGGYATGELYVSSSIYPSIDTALGAWRTKCGWFDSWTQVLRRLCVFMVISKDLKSALLFGPLAPSMDVSKLLLEGGFPHGQLAFTSLEHPLSWMQEPVLKHAWHSSVSGAVPQRDGSVAGNVRHMGTTQRSWSMCSSSCFQHGIAWAARDTLISATWKSRLSVLQDPFHSLHGHLALFSF